MEVFNLLRQTPGSRQEVFSKDSRILPWFPLHLAKDNVISWIKVNFFSLNLMIMLSPILCHKIHMYVLGGYNKYRRF